VQNAVHNVDYGHLKSLDFARESKTFSTPWSGPWNLSFGLDIDNSTRQPYFCLETDFMPAFQMHNHKDVSLMQFQLNVCLFYNIAK